MPFPNATDIVKGNCKIKFCFPEFNGNIKIKLKDKINNQIVYNFQDLDELNKILKKINGQNIWILNSESKTHYRSRYILDIFFLLSLF